MLEVEVRQLVQRHVKELGAKDAAIQLLSQKVIFVYYVFCLAGSILLLKTIHTPHLMFSLEQVVYSPLHLQWLINSNIICAKSVH